MANYGRIDMRKLEGLAKRAGITPEELRAELAARGLSRVAFMTGDSPLLATNNR